MMIQEVLISLKTRPRAIDERTKGARECNMSRFGQWNKISGSLIHGGSDESVVTLKYLGSVLMAVQNKIRSMG
jgi:hypothetical protein